MLGRTPALRATLAAAVLTAAAAFTPTAARAQATTITFTSLNATDGTGTTYVNNCYTESGFTFTATGVACGTPYTFAAFNDDAAYASPALGTNNPAMSLNQGASSIDITRVGGGAFGFQSIQLSPFIGSTTNVSLFATLFGGGSISAVCPTIPGTATSFATCTPAAFAGLTFASLRISSLNANGEPYVLMDNVRLTASATAVPEPATVALVGAGLLALGTAARRRRA